jgi:hypothetical protein
MRFSKMKAYMGCFFRKALHVNQIRAYYQLDITCQHANLHCRFLDIQSDPQAFTIFHVNNMAVLR